MGRSKYLYKTRGEYEVALKRAKDSERAMGWIARGIRENRTVEFWINWDSNDYHFLACWSPREVQFVVAYVSAQGSLEAYDEHMVSDMARDSTSWVYPLWDLVLRRTNELLMDTREVFNAFVEASK